MSNPKSKEQQDWEQGLLDNRLNEQKNNKDYNDEMEKCSDCGSLLNSHDHCPRCDY